MYLLGLSCFYHDSAACLLKDGVVVAAVQEERFTRVKNDRSLPVQSINSCLEIEGILLEDIQAIVYHEKPFLKFERILENFIDTVPFGLSSFVDTIPSWLRRKLWFENVLRKQTGYNGVVLYGDHHLSHAASSFYLSPFEESAVLTIDGVGEWATASWGYGSGSRLELSHEMRFPHSVGLLYSAFTAYLGFEVNDGEYKVMGMASYGSPVYADLIKSRLVKIFADGSIRLAMEYFAFQFGRCMVNRRFEQLFGLPQRQIDGEIHEQHFDIAASIQAVTEEILLAMARHIHTETGQKRLCMAGGVALNCVANARLLRDGPFSEIFVQPAAGDAGGAVGAALLAWHNHYAGTERTPLDTVFWGPSFDAIATETALKEHGDKLSWTSYEEGELVSATACLLEEGCVVGWFQGRMEFGPRALGNRSILADPRLGGMKDTVNGIIKFRESFRPFAPAVPLDESGRFFALHGESPFMLFTAAVTSDLIPAVTHEDGSARVQTVQSAQNPRFYSLLKEFGRRTGVPVLMNTSFNLKGEPIVCTPADAISTFLRCGMDALVIGCLLIKKKEHL